MMLLPKGVEMNDLLALAEEMHPDLHQSTKDKKKNLQVCRPTLVAY